jgi:hypothetical protein
MVANVHPGEGRRVAMAKLDAIQRAVREGKLQRLVNNVEAQVKAEAGQGAEFVLVVVEQDGAAKTVSVLSGVDDEQIPKVLSQALRAVRGDG